LDVEWPFRQINNQKSSIINRQSKGFPDNRHSAWRTTLTEAWRAGLSPGTEGSGPATAGQLPDFDEVVALGDEGFDLREQRLEPFNPSTEVQIQV
jgi:hypothetical protein